MTPPAAENVSVQVVLRPHLLVRDAPLPEVGSLRSGAKGERHLPMMASAGAMLRTNGTRGGTRMGTAMRVLGLLVLAAGVAAGLVLAAG
jgi:hypothetical protein